MLWWADSGMCVVVEQKWSVCCIRTVVGRVLWWAVVGICVVVGPGSGAIFFCNIKSRITFSILRAQGSYID